MMSLSGSEQTNLEAFPAGEHLGVDDVFITSLGSHVIVHYYDPVCSAPCGEHGLNSRFDLTDNRDIAPGPA